MIGDWVSIAHNNNNNNISKKIVNFLIIKKTHIILRQLIDRGRKHEKAGKFTSI